MRTAISVLAATLAVAAGTGCSRDENGSSAGTTAPPSTSATPATTEPTTTAPPTTTEPPTPTAPINAWARKADAICERYQKQIEAVPPPTGPEQVAPTLEKTLVPIRKQEQALKKLGPPTANRTIGLAFIGSIVSTRKALERVVAALEANDEAASAEGYAAAAAAGARTRTYASQLGLVSCGADRAPSAS